MMRQKMTYNEIFQYLSQKNFNLTSDKVLKDPLGNPDIIWNILIFLTQNIRDTKFNQIQPTLSYLMDESHKNSMRKIKQYSILCETLNKIYHKRDQYYPFKEILKPQKQSVHEKISTLICANKYWEKIVKQFDSRRTYVKLKKLQVQSLIKKLGDLNLEIEEMKLIKQKQRSAFEQKKLSIQNLSKDFNYKKKQRLDLLNSQILLEAEQKNKVKDNDELEYSIDDLSIKIKQLERQIIRNAPKLKKERIEKKEKYQKLMKRNGEYFDLLKTKIKVFSEKIMLSQDVKYKSKTFKIAKRFKQLSNKLQKYNKFTLAISRKTESKKQLQAQKKQALKSYYMLSKKKKERMSRIAQKQNFSAIMKRAEKVMRDEVKLNQRNVKILHQKYAQSKNQYKTITEKINYKRQKMLRKIFEFKFRLKLLETQSNDLCDQTFERML